MEKKLCYRCRQISASTKPLIKMIHQNLSQQYLCNNCEGKCLHQDQEISTTTNQKNQKINIIRHLQCSRDILLTNGIFCEQHVALAKNCKCELCTLVCGQCYKNFLTHFCGKKSRDSDSDFNFSCGRRLCDDCQCDCQNRF